MTNLRQIGAETGRRMDCTSTVTLFNSSTNTNGVWLCFLNVYRILTFDTYTVSIDFTPFDGDDQYAYKFAVCRATNDISDTASAQGIGQLVAGTELASGTKTGNLSLRNTAPLATPVTLQPGSYFVAFTPYLIGTITGALTVVSNDGIDCFTAGLTGIDNGDRYGVLATTATFPSTLTTNGGTMTSLGNCFATVDSFWAGIFDSRST